MRALAGLVAALLPACLLAQEPAPALADVAVAVAAYWGQGDAQGLASVVSDGGARLHLEGERHPALAARQVRATLEDLFGERQRGRVVVEKAERVGGAPPRGWAELRWETAPPGAAEAVAYRVFVGFVGDGGRWRIDEIRVLR